MAEGCFVVNDVRITGPMKDLNRLEAAIEASAIDRGQGYSCFKQFEIDPDKWAAAIPEWGEFRIPWNLDSRFGDTRILNSEKHRRYSEEDDGRPVRISNGALLFKCVTLSTPPFDSVKRLGELFPEVEVHVVSLELMNGILDVWESRAGQCEIIEHQMSIWLEDGIYEWKKQGKVWQWTDDELADITMMGAFLRDDLLEAELDVTADDVHSACQIAYEILAPHEAALPEDANGYAYALASTIAKYGCDVDRICDAIRIEERMEDCEGPNSVSDDRAPWD